MRPWVIRMRFKFDEFCVDTDQFELRFQDEIRPVEPKVFSLIAHFVSEPNRVFSRDELIDTVWEGRIVSEASIASCVKNARKALKHPSDKKNYIETIRGRGFRFNATVASEQQKPTLAPVTPVDYVKSSKPSSDPTLIILPFRCLSDDIELNRISQGLAIELSRILTRIPLLRQSTQSRIYEQRSVPPTAREIYEDLGVNFVLEGTFQTVGESIHFNTQLSDARGGVQIWSYSYDLPGTDKESFTQLVHAVIAKLEPQLHRAMYKAVVSQETDLSARQLFLEANGLLVMQGWNHESFPKASEKLIQSIELDPNFALSPALLSMLTGFGTRMGLNEHTEARISETVGYAEMGLELDNMDSTVLGLCGCSLADVGYSSRGESLLQHAIEINSSNAQAWVALGAVKLEQGNFTDGINDLSHGINISPLDSRLSIWRAIQSVAFLASGDLNAALSSAQAACHQHDNTYLARVALAAVELARKNPRGAYIALKEARRIHPALTKQQIQRLVGREVSTGLDALEATRNQSQRTNYYD